MEVKLFNLDFSRWEIIILSLVPSCINIFIFLYSFFVLEKTRATTYFSMFVLFVGLWQLADGIMKISRTIETAEDWNRIANLFVLITIPVGIQFIIYLTGWPGRKSGRIISAILYLPTIIFFVLIEGRLDEYSFVKSDIVNWIVNPEPTIVTISLFLWVALGALLMLLLLWMYYFKSINNNLRQKQALLLALGLTLPILGGILYEIVYPLFFNYNSIPVTTSLLTIFSIMSLIAMKRYRMLEYSPKHQWEQIVESMNEGILIVDNKDRIRYANNTFCNLMEYEFEEIKGKVANELFLGDEERKAIKNIIIDRKNRKVSQYEMQLSTKSGKKIWMLISGSPYTDRKGRVVGSIGVQTNITHFKETEKRLEHNEFRLKQAQEVAHVGSWELNFATKEALWSDEACRMYGLLPTERNGQSFESWISFIHPEDLDGVKKEIERNQANLSDSSLKHRIVWKDGTVKHIHSVSKFEFNDAGFPIGLFGICHDITDQVENEKALLESETNMRTFINESLMSIYFIDPKTKKIQYSNPALSKLLGFSHEELKSISPYDFINHSKEDVDERMREVMELKSITNGERQWRRKDGEIVYVLVSSFYHKRNGTEAIYVAAQNITQRKKVERKLKAANQDLRTFIYRASHDIRGPLASVMGLVNVCKSEIKEETSIKYLNMIGSATQKLDYILGDLVKSMQMQGIETFSDKIDFHQLTSDVCKKFEHFPGYNQLDIRTEISFRKPFYSNKSILETILQNLVENGIKYQKKNGAHQFLKINISADEKRIKLTVEDNGVGIEDSLQSHVFDMFFRGNTSSAGSGLGLYLVRNGVDKLNGQIQLESKLLYGTIFTILLPLKRVA